MPSRRGIATIEFALLTLLLLLLVAGVLDYTMLLRTTIAVADAARAGAQYGSLSATHATDLNGMKAAASAAAPDIGAVTPTAAEVCQCSDGSTVYCTGGSCSSGPVRIYAQVTVQAICGNLFSYAPLPFSGAVSATAKMRAQ
jgi:Flp pilus assembly protein TadG